MLKTGLQWKVTIAVLVAVGLTSGVAQADAPLFPSGSASGSASDPDAGQDGLLPNPNGPTVDDVPDDPIGGVKRLKFKQDPQEEDQWCWSAASVSIADFHKKKISQDDFCRHVFGIDSATGKCPNRPANFGQVVHAFTEEGFDAKTVEKPFTLGQIKHEIDAGRPIETGVEWQNRTSNTPVGGGHARVIYGYNANKDTIDFSDPWGASTRYETADYDFYLDNPGTRGVNGWKYIDTVYEIEPR
ncbi:papain-like cysteine protease family protein [Nocardia terpenica]|uniref:papain-like cysteine protease family protein n=1 Tax=Nocardia terpenica TaxID=455432 RepID=UPI0009ECE9A6|nr:papain-like cysteine protease family protein [Nocardia terpenica]NQE91218.1 hypothetical protein [Nocardia terpenica]